MPISFDYFAFFDPLKSNFNFVLKILS